MKCKNCGGKLLFSSGVGVCENCENTFSFDFGFEKTEIFICYSEYDSQGRRAADSIKAEEIYHTLQNKKIDTFFSRISAAGQSPDELDALEYQAIYSSKVILLFGSSPKAFTYLYEKYSKFFDGKTIIPVYSNMKADELPSGIRNVQALNFDAIGALPDLANNLLSLLGREQEIDLTKLREKTQKKKKTIIICLITTIIIIAAGFLLFLHPADKKDPPTEISASEIYDNAVYLMNEGKFLEAATLFRSIPDYKDSNNVCKRIYDRYDGYYETEDTSFAFYINIKNSNTADISLKKKINGKTIQAQLTTPFTENDFSATFTDSKGNPGTINVGLNDNSISIFINNSANDDISLGDIEVSFSLFQKRDKPAENEITQETIENWISEGTSLKDLQQSDLSLKYEYALGINSAPTANLLAYSIENTDIKLLIAGFDLSLEGYCSPEEAGVVLGGFDFDENSLKIAGVICPAELIIPHKIGDLPDIWIENDFIKAAYSKMFSYIMGDNIFDLYENRYDKDFHEKINSPITKDTPVAVMSKKTLGDPNFNKTYSYNKEILTIARDKDLYKMVYEDN